MLDIHQIVVVETAYGSDSLPNSPFSVMKRVAFGEANAFGPALGYPSCMICLRPSSSAAISSVVTAPSRLRRRSFATARIWSLTATAGRPSQEIGIRIGGLAFGELDSGTTITVLRLSFSTLTEITTQGRVLRISEPSVGSK